ncbi:unnamed protein product [Sphagnum balticum]
MTLEKDLEVHLKSTLKLTTAPQLMPVELSLLMEQSEAVPKEEALYCVQGTVTQLDKAREHVHVSDEARGLGVVEVADCIGVYSSIRGVASNDDEVVSAVFDTLVSGGGEQLRDVYT